MLKDLLSTGIFLWGGRWHLTAPGIDCLGLAIEVRGRILPNAEQLPDFPEIYSKFSRDKLPFDRVLELVSNHLRTTIVGLPTVGDLAVIEGDRGMILGTFVGDYDGVKDGVIFFGIEERPIIVADCKIVDLQGYWRFG
jgi:hypothetical protein